MSAPVVEDAHNRTPPFATGPVAAVTIAAGIVAVLSATRYGYYYDELYFIAAGKRPSFSYADQGPLVPFLARGVDWAFPGSFVALRVPGIVAVLVVVVVSALIACELGGGRRAQVLAAMGCSTAFGILGEAGTLTTNIIDTAMWAVLTWLVVRWVRTRHDGLLLAAGLVTMAALQVKFLIPVFWIAMLIAVACVGPRELLRRPALWCGAIAVTLSGVPMLVWQSQHGWPQAAMGTVIRGQTSMLYGSATFIPRAIQMCGLIGAVLLVYGTWRLCRSPRLRPYRFLGVAFLMVVTVFAVTGGRIQYGIGIYAAVIAAGAVELSALRNRWVMATAIPLTVASIAVFVLWATPWRPASRLIPAADFTEGLAIQAYGEFGWSELTTEVSNAYRELPSAQRNNAVIVTERYIQASALDYNRERADLPAIFSPKRGFGYFGAPPDNAETIVWVGSNRADLQARFASVVEVERFGVRLGMPQVTRGITIWKCVGPLQPWSIMWPRMQSL